MTNVKELIKALEPIEGPEDYLIGDKIDYNEKILKQIIEELDK